MTGFDHPGRRMYKQDWGWIGQPGDPRRRYVRRIRLTRGAGEEEIILLTDLVEAEAYPAGDLLQIYLERWGIRPHPRIDTLTISVGIDTSAVGYSQAGEFRDPVIHRLAKSLPVRAFLENGLKPQKQRLLDAALEVVASAGDVVVATLPVAAGPPPVLEAGWAQFRTASSVSIQVFRAGRHDPIVELGGDYPPDFCLQELEEPLARNVEGLFVLILVGCVTESSPATESQNSLDVRNVGQRLSQASQASVVCLTCSAESASPGSRFNQLFEWLRIHDNRAGVQNSIRNIVRVPDECKPDVLGAVVDGECGRCRGHRFREPGVPDKTQGGTRLPEVITGASFVLRVCKGERSVLGRNCRVRDLCIHPGDASTTCAAEVASTGGKRRCLKPAGCWTSHETSQSSHRPEENDVV